MFSSGKILMASKPRYQMGSDIVQVGSNGRFCMSADGRVVAVWVFDASSVSNKVVVRRWTGSAWEQMGSGINVSEQGVVDPGVGVERFSLSLDASGTTLAVGSPTGLGTVDGRPVVGLGRVYVYGWSGSSWSAKGDVILNPTADSPIGVNGNPGFGFGGDVSLSRDGTRLAVGAFEKNDRNPFVAVYYWTDPIDGGANGPSLPGSWALERTILGSSFTQDRWDNSGQPFSDMTGKSVSLSSDGGLVAWGWLSIYGSGGLKVHTLPCPTCGPSSFEIMWKQSLSSDARTDNPMSVSLSGDGSTVAVSDGGYIHERDVAIPPRTTVYRKIGQSWSELGSEGILSGRTRLSHDGNVASTSDGFVYRWDGSSWVRSGGQMVPFNFSNECAISGDGTVVAQGGRANGSYVCRVFKWS
jgi:hypothetical protein